MYIQTVSQAVSTLAVTAVSVYACWRGGGAERLGGIVTFLDWMLTPLAEKLTGIRDVELGVLAIDALFLVVLLSIAFKSSRFWPLFAAGFYVLEVLMHMAMAVDAKVGARAYFVGMEIFSYLTLAALAVGVWFETPRGRLSLFISQKRLSRDGSASPPPCGEG
jgi:hypothetical protein